jgi:hypothetical protein
MSLSFRLHDVDPIGLAMDWLETCKGQQATSLVDLYADNAVLECLCGCPGTFVGRGQILEYWRPKLATPAPRPFRLEQIWPEASGIALVYRYQERMLIRTSFQFDGAGKIELSRCRPEPLLPIGNFDRGPTR